jgi:hypothetical protein
MEGQDGKFDKLQVNEIDSPLTAPVIVTPILRYDAPKLFTDPQDIPDKQYVDAGVGGAAISKTLTTSDPDTYTLSPAELVTLNLYTRYPNFVAIVTSTGQQFSDIFPIYTGTVGNFTDCVVELHSDGLGNNADNTIIQFS